MKSSSFSILRSLILILAWISPTPTTASFLGVPYNVNPPSIFSSPVVPHPQLSKFANSQSNIVLNINLDIPENIQDRYNPQNSRLMITNLKLQLTSEAAIIASEYDGYSPMKEHESDVHSSPLRVKVHNSGQFSSLKGTQFVEFENSCWQLVWKENEPIGTLVLGFHLFDEKKRNDARLKSGNVYLTFCIFEQKAMTWFQERQNEYSFQMEAYFQNQAKSLESINSTNNVLKKLWYFKTMTDRYNQIMDMKEKFDKEVPTVESIGGLLVGINENLLVSAKGQVWYKPFDDTDGDYELVGYSELK